MTEWGDDTHFEKQADSVLINSFIPVLCENDVTKDKKQVTLEFSWSNKNNRDQIYTIGNK